MVDFADGLRWTFVMAGLERDLLDGRRAAAGIPIELEARLTREWLRVADRSGAPIDPLIWSESPPISSQPACMAVKAATAQAGDDGYRYLRLLREGLMCHRRKLDGADALSEVARAAGLEVGKFGIDLRSHGTVEELGTDLDRTAKLGARGQKAKLASYATGAPLPAVLFAGDDGVEYGVFGMAPYEAYRDAVIAAGARPADPGPLSPADALERFGSLTGAEVELLCDLPSLRVGAEMLKLVEQSKARPQWCMTGHLWERA